MKRQAQQPLCKGAGGDFGEARKARSPAPRSNRQKAYPMLAAQRRAAARAVEVMVELVSQENRLRSVDAGTERVAALGDQPVQTQNRREIKRDAPRAHGIVGKDDHAAETRFVFAAND